MARKEKKYHFIYKTTNLLSGKYYIGMHSTDNLEDGYMGSGNRLRLAIRKHGIENFKREILEFVDSRKLLAEREGEIITLDEIAKVECMNLKVGGEGGWHEDASKAFIKRLRNDVELQKKYKEAGKKQMALLHKNGKVKYGISFKGKIHSDETKQLISEVMKGKGTGSNNSQFGKCWITNEIESKKINKGDTIPYGWRLGRKMK